MTHSAERPLRVMVLHGPNLNLSGKREPEIYGSFTLEDINKATRNVAQKFGVDVECSQSNHEGQLIDWLHQASAFDGIVINPAAYTHTSIVLRDAIAATRRPCVEVHLTNIYAREEFRRRSLVAGVCLGTVAGFGIMSYTL